MPPPPRAPATGLAITDPLVLYRAHVAARRIRPDEAQHRLAIHLQRLSVRLRDYRPRPDFRAAVAALSAPRPAPFLSPRAGAGQRALVPRLSRAEAARALDAPRGLLLHGEVGTGKSMLVDLLAASLPTARKRRAHYGAFMLDALARLDRAQRRGGGGSAGVYGGEQAECVAAVARDMVEQAPVLFLDEFQMPDRAAASIVTGLFGAFFLMGGVLVATSNRLPEELDRAAGVQLGGAVGALGRAREMVFGRPAPSEFSVFLDILRARCEVWDMRGSRDWRRVEMQEAAADAGPSLTETRDSLLSHYFVRTRPQTPAQDRAWDSAVHSAVRPDAPDPVRWTPSSLAVYGRTVPVPRSCAGATLWTFDELCCARLGPADYITLASTYHTLILTDVPVLTLLQRNEARRFITLLDALYEARCKLLVRAAAGPDDLFFPEASGSEAAAEAHPEHDTTYPETFSEIYQDAVAPFRPNAAEYVPSASAPSYASSALPAVGARSSRTGRSVLADEDADFGGSPDFQMTGTFTGEDERFAYKRARSRLWEMCGARWWARTEEGWWKPLEKGERHWEDRAKEGGDEGGRRAEVSRGGSPFRTSAEPPPKISWTHAWGMVRWGRKAGAWGGGVEGRAERQQDREEGGSGTGKA